MRLRDPAWTRVLIVALPELTPVSEAAALQGISAARVSSRSGGWSTRALSPAGRAIRFCARAALEARQLHRVRNELAHRAWLVPWRSHSPTGEAGLAALTHA